MGLIETNGLYVNSYSSPSYLGHSRTLEDLNFHCSWDWLVPAVHKILYASYTLEGVRYMRRVQDAFITCNILKTYTEVIRMIELLETEE